MLLFLSVCWSVCLYVCLEHAMPITLHANGEPILKRSSSYSHSFPVCNDSAFVWSANGDAAVVLLLPRVVPID